MYLEAVIIYQRYKSMVRIQNLVGIVLQNVLV